MSLKRFLAACACALWTAPASATPTPAAMAQRIDTLPYFSQAIIGGYKVSAHEVLKDIAPDAAKLGVKAGAGYLVEKPSGLYRTVLISFSFFDDAKNAESYFRKSLTDEDGNLITHNLDITLANLPAGSRVSTKQRLRCAVVEVQGYSLGCAVYDPQVLAVISFALSPGVSPSERQGDELKLATVWRVAPPGDVINAMMIGALDQLARASAD